MTNIHFITLSRSDYASLQPVALAAESDPAIDLTLVAGGSHLLKRFGETIVDIRNDGYKNIVEIDFLKEDDDSDEDMAAAYARALQMFVEHFTATKPDMVFIVGDRWEMMAVATAASMLRIPITHHSGGDITQGSADNQTRYVLSTLSHIHLVALEQHKERLIHMGEEEWRITVTGEPALCGLSDIAKKVSNIHEGLGLAQGDNFVLATFHPTSYDNMPFDDQLDVFISALDLIDQKIVLTAPNPDPGSATFFQKLSAYADGKDNVQLFENLGRDNYYAAMAVADFMIGNSSSGLWEAPSFNLPVINMGSRQDGRLRGGNVIDVPLDTEAVKSALVKVADNEFRSAIKDGANPYINDDCLDLILTNLKTAAPKEKLLAKVFVDPLEA